MHPDKVRREQVRRLTDLPNIGPSLAGNPPRVWWHYTAERKQRWPLL